MRLAAPGIGNSRKKRTVKPGFCGNFDHTPLTAMNPPTKNHVFGPVPSRRIGRSLGVDLVPFKTCTYDCIYCQLGSTTHLTLERREWVPMDAVLEELERKLACSPDYITLSGSGEPTLYARLGELIERIKAMTDVPVAVLTSGSLLWRKEVREQVALADLVLPSLDADNDCNFRFINRPHPDITFEQMFEGLVALRTEFTGQYWLEVFLLGGYTAIEANVKRLAALAKRIGPDRVQLNTVARPPTEEFAMAVPPEALEKYARFFDPPAEVIAERPSRLGHKTDKLQPGDVLEMLRRRPCTVDQVALGLRLNRMEVIKQLEALMAEQHIESYRHEGGVFYRATGHQQPS
jgi:wyosine [tRNA(Phe)-imidazoG37] synthetase (radical SAM superfamily)